MAANLDDVIDRYHAALDAFMRGDCEPARVMFSERDDVTLANPFGPVARGHEQVVDAMRRAAANYKDGMATGFESFARHVDGGLACIVETERLRSKVGGRQDLTDVALRVTTIFRQEDGAWKIVHRHADPIVTVRPPDSVVQPPA